MTPMSLGAHMAKQIKDNKDNKDNIAKTMAKKAVRTAATNMLAKAGAAIVSGLLFKMAAKAIASVVGTIFGKIGSAIAALWHKATSLVVSAVNYIASALNISVIASSFIVMGSVLTTTAVVAYTGIHYIITVHHMRTEGIIDCKTDVADSIGDAEISDAKKEEVATKITAVFKAIGIPDTNIAGALGNMEAECGLDYTCVETIYDEPFAIGPRKKHAEEVDYIVGRINPSYGNRFPKIKRVGIGLTQWTDTNDGATENTDLRAFASRCNSKWYNFDVQLAFIIAGTEGRSKWLLKWTAPEKSPEAAAYTFAKRYEGNTTMAQDKRKKKAAEWYVKIKSLPINAAYGNSIVELARLAGGMATSNGISDSLKNCVKDQSYNNSDLANALVSYAWPTIAQSKGNNGTKLYITVHDNVGFKGQIYQSCDRSVASAVRWAGYDDHFEPGNTGNQYRYMAANPDRWEVIPWKGGEENLQPGDIMISGTGTKFARGKMGHIIGYVGPEIVKLVHGNKAKPGSSVVHGSYGERSPGCGLFTEMFRSGNSDILNREYVIFRNKKRESNSKYTGAAGAAGSKSYMSKHSDDKPPSPSTFIYPN